MRLVARVITALALVAFAAPALPCGAEKANRNVRSEQQQTGAVAKADSGEKSKKAEKSQKAKNVEPQKAAVAN